MRKVILFGIDGGSLKLIERWKDELPNFKRIMEGSVFGELESTVPPLSCPAWPCMFTGKNPGKLGMYDFISLQPMQEQGLRVFNSSDYHNSSIWKILNDYGKKVGLLNVPITFPPHRIDSFMVCGLGTPQTANTNYTYPPELKNKLSEIVGGYEVLPAIVLTRHGEEKEYLKMFNETLSKGVKAAQYLMSSFPWDLFVCVFFVSDVVQHYFWHHMDVNHPRHVDNSAYKDAIKNFYKRIDEAIGTLTKQFQKDTDILIVSDHGFGPLYGGFSINKWLQDNDFLRYQSSIQDEPMKSGLLKLRDFLLIRLNLRLIHLITRLMPDTLAQRLVFTAEEKDQTLKMLRSINWTRTKAYALGQMGKIFINLKGRQPNGIVEPGREYERVRDDIIEGLYQMVNPETGKSLGFQIYKREELYHGQFADLAPDIVVVAEKYYPLTSSSELRLCEPTTAISATHTRQGVFMAFGTDIKKEGLRLVGLKIYDIAPTILHILGLPVPKDMDGRVVSEIFKPGAEPATRPVVCEEVNERQRIRGKIKRLKASGSV